MTLFCPSTSLSPVHPLLHTSVYHPHALFSNHLAATSETGSLLFLSYLRKPIALEHKALKFQHQTQLCIPPSRFLTQDHYQDRSDKYDQGQARSDKYGQGQRDFQGTGLRFPTFPTRNTGTA